MENNLDYKSVTQNQIAEWLNMKRHQLCWIIKKNGRDEVVDRLESCGRYVCYEPIDKNVRFYLVGD